MADGHRLQLFQGEARKHLAAQADSGWNGDFMVIYWDFIGFNGISWDFMGFYDDFMVMVVQWDLAIYNHISWDHAP